MGNQTVFVGVEDVDSGKWVGETPAPKKTDKTPKQTTIKTQKTPEGELCQLTFKLTSQHEIRTVKRWLDTEGWTYTEEEE